MRDVLSDGGFQAALAVGLVLAAGQWLLDRRQLPAPGSAVVAVVATLVGFRVDHALHADLVVAMAVLVAGEWVATRQGSAWSRFAFLVPGALVLVVSLPDLSFGFEATVALATVALAPLVGVTATRDPRLTALVFAVSGVGLYACVPDTELARIVLAALAAAAVLVFDEELTVPVGTAALTGLFAWTAVVEGQGRTGSVVGGIACLGVLVLIPLAGWDRDRRGPWWVLLATQVGYVAFVARVAGFRDSAAAAVALAVPATVVAFFVIAVVARGAGARE